MIKLQFLEAPNFSISILTDKNEHLGYIDARGDFCPAFNINLHVEAMRLIMEFMIVIGDASKKMQADFYAAAKSQGLGRSPTQV